MKYLDFLEKFKNHVLIDRTEVKIAFPDFGRRRLYEWQKSNKIKKVVRGFYVFSDKILTENNLNSIANKLHGPSYLSLEYALSYYSLIPETVFVRTSVGTKKTLKIETIVGNFSYRTIKKNLFFGYVIKGEDSAKFRIAEPEKALLDFLYLRADIKNSDDIESLRINQDGYKQLINEEKLDSYLKLFHSPTLNKKVKILKNQMKQND